MCVHSVLEVQSSIQNLHEVTMQSYYDVDTYNYIIMLVLRMLSTLYPGVEYVVMCYRTMS